eukprot:COSAG01_NODE_16988_length_1188_cov_0.847567_1_plen_67_part_00
MELRLTMGPAAAAAAPANQLQGGGAEAGPHLRQIAAACAHAGRFFIVEMAISAEIYLCHAWLFSRD